MFWAAKKAARNGCVTETPEISETSEILRDFRKIDFLFCEMFFLRISKAEPQRHFVLDLECQTGISSFCIFNMLKKITMDCFLRIFFIIFFELESRLQYADGWSFCVLGFSHREKKFLRQWYRELCSRVPSLVKADKRRRSRSVVPRRGWQAKP